MAETHSWGRHPTPDWVEHHIIPDTYTYDLKRVLFVCCAGTGISKSAMDLFKKAAEGEPLHTAFRLDHTGIYASDFKKKLANADYVVPMGPSFIPIIREAIKGFQKKPKIIPIFRIVEHFREPAYHKRLFRIINKHGHRQRARRLYNY